MPDRRERAEGLRVEREVVLPAPADVVWEALTDAEELSGWFGAEVELDPRPGGAGRFTGEDGDVRRAVVETVEPERHLRFVWWPENGTAAPTSVDFELSETDDAGATRLVVIEAPVASAAWPVTLARLQARCSTYSRILAGA